MGYHDGNETATTFVMSQFCDNNFKFYFKTLTVKTFAHTHITHKRINAQTDTDAPQHTTHNDLIPLLTSRFSWTPPAGAHSPHSLHQEFHPCHCRTATEHYSNIN